MKTKKIVIAGGTGFLGHSLIREFGPADEIVVLTRTPHRPEKNVRFVVWDARAMTGWEHELEGADVLVNLTGKSIDCRYTPANKHAILHSRTDSTNILAMAVMCCKHPPKHWLNASTATIYRHSPDKQMDDISGDIGDDFSMNVAKAWEAAFFEIDTPKTLKTALRTGIVLGKSGGAFPALKNLVHYGMGGKQGNGRQFISWIHEKDFARAVSFLIGHHIEGAVNVVSPQPVRNADFMNAMRRVLRVPAGIPLGKNLLEIGAKLIGTETELVLKSRNVIPKRLLDAGFRFLYTMPETAIAELVAP